MPASQLLLILKAFFELLNVLQFRDMLKCGRCTCESSRFTLDERILQVPHSTLFAAVKWGRVLTNDNAGFSRLLLWLLLLLLPLLLFLRLLLGTTRLGSFLLGATAVTAVTRRLGLWWWSAWSDLTCTVQKTASEI